MLLLLLLLLFEVVGKDADHVGEGGRIRERLRQRRGRAGGEEGMLRRHPGVCLFLVVVVLQERRRRVVQHVSPGQMFQW